ncbi:hypothetical protein AVEN_226971-1 [Araneus ventricosus]|uniref:Uncharacterized protein n=1 Tax=Araneus ventricosus TaxID=182803 RepID=A0A4Y2ITE3_ARAVE|nr:hypothetical protein AVEN_226971-1 [Araneus ventricosus]
MNLVILNRYQVTRTTPELAPLSPDFRATPTGGRLATTYDLVCNRPHTRRIFRGIKFRTCDPPAFQNRDLTTRPPWPSERPERADILTSLANSFSLCKAKINLKACLFYFEREKKYDDTLRDFKRQ